MLRKNKGTKSIRTELVKRISILISVILFFIFLFIDLNLDSWVDQRFDSTLLNKAILLQTLVKQHDGHIELNIAPSLMPEFEAKQATDFYQLWLNDAELIRSNSLGSYQDKHLVRLSPPLGSHRFADAQLPDGGSGRAISITFTPQTTSHDTVSQQQVELTLITSKSALNNILLSIDFSLIFTLILTNFCVWMLIRKVIKHELQPLIKLNNDIRNIDISKQQAAFKVSDNQPIELRPISAELNNLINRNATLLNNERNLTSDIAHELKTPIAELLSSAEIAERFPNDPRVRQHFISDVISSANHLKDVVDKLLIFHRSMGNMELTYQSVDLAELIHCVWASISNKYPQRNCSLSTQLAIKQIDTDRFYLELILRNLLDNAMYHGTPNSTIELTINNALSDRKHWSLTVSNPVSHTITEQTLGQLFKPFYQLDESRTENGHHGLGLPIIEKICDKMAIAITAKCQNQQFSITLTK